MADFPSGLKPSVNQGYSLSSAENVLSQDVQGGPSLMMLDYATGPTPFNIGLVLTPAELQTFQEFYFNDINSGALPFDMNLDAGLGIASHRVVINNNSLNIDGSRAPMWTASFSVKLTPNQDVIFKGLGFHSSHSGATLSPDKKELHPNPLDATSQFAFACNHLVRDTYWEVQSFSDEGRYSGVSVESDYNINLSPFSNGNNVTYLRVNTSPDRVYKGSANLGPIGMDQSPLSSDGSVITSWRYDHAAKKMYVSPDAASWVEFKYPANSLVYSAILIMTGTEGYIRMAFIKDDCIRPVPSGYSTYDNDYTAP
jgi:hypothetical protein